MLTGPRPTDDAGIADDATTDVAAAQFMAGASLSGYAKAAGTSSVDSDMDTPAPGQQITMK